MTGQEQNERRIKYELATTLLKQAPSERTSYLQAIVDQWDKTHPESTPPEAAERSSVADSMQSLVRAAGSDEARFRRSIENILYDEAQPLRRKQEE